MGLEAPKIKTAAVLLDYINLQGCCGLFFGFFCDGVYLLVVLK